MINLIVSIVLYHNKKEQIKQVLQNFLGSQLNIRIILIDNSSNDDLQVLSKIDERIEYIFSNINLGYGRAHNIALKKSLEENVPYHLVLNPDVYFDNGVLEELYNFMENNKDVGLVMPKVLYPDGNIQYLCKLVPTPFDLFGRRFLNFGIFKKYIERRNQIFELRFTGYDKIMNVPYLSGCFMFLRTKVLKDVGLFDERYFMYPEDIDLTRRINIMYKTLYYPFVHIVHDHGKESYKNKKMLFIHIINIIKYFNKWGWFFDRNRRMINHKTLHELLGE